MLYDCQNPPVKIDTVEIFTWSAGYFKIPSRGFAGLAFRIYGDADIRCAGKHYSVTPGQLLYMPQDISYDADYTDTEMIAIHFRTATTDKELEIYDLQKPKNVEVLFRDACTLWKNKEPGYLPRLMTIFYKILSEVSENETNVLLPKSFTDAIAIINVSFRSSSLTIGNICKEAAISETSLRELFRKHYKKTPVEYITDLRIEHARNLIASNVSVEEAAFQSGFNDPKYFSRVVKNKFGHTPRQWKLYGK